VSELQELAERVERDIRDWPHGFVHPLLGSDIGYELIVGGRAAARAEQENCEKCRARSNGGTEPLST
jgi:hypothetical protein